MEYLPLTTYCVRVYDEYDLGNEVKKMNIAWNWL